RGIRSVRAGSTRRLGATGPAIVAEGSVLPQVRQSAAHPPAPGLGVVAPLLQVPDLALDLGIAVDHAQLDAAAGGVAADHGAAVVVAGDPDLLVTRELP